MDPATRLDYKKQLMQGAHNCKSICEELRMIYDIIHDVQDLGRKAELTEMLVDAFIMVKKMHDRLVYYRERYGGDSEKRTKLLEITGTRERLVMRRQRVVE